MQLFRTVASEKCVRLPTVLAAGSNPEVSTEASRHNALELRLHVFDRRAGIKFLVDSGSTISLLPRSYAQQKTNPQELRLTAATGSNIATFGERVLTVDLGLRRAISWAFVVADVSSAILGAEFLTYYDLIVDLKRQRITDSLTPCYSEGVAQRADVVSVNVVPHNINAVGGSNRRSGR